VLRNWRPGDAYCPKGHTQVRKVKRLFWEYGIDAWRRPGWPVLTSAGKPVWARGFPAAAEAAAGSATRRALVITEEPL
jgi:tRNA(Ile)-lysidine synthetase-like protein